MLFGWLSDKVGRKPIILGGCIIAALTYFPVFRSYIGGGRQSSAVAGPRDGESCGGGRSRRLLLPVQPGRARLAKFANSCDVAKGALSRASVVYSHEVAPPGTPASVRIGDQTISATSATFAKDLAGALTSVGYPAASNPSVVKLAHPWDVFRPQPFTLVLILAFLVILVTMVYGPIAAALVELFPTRIRYTSMSLPYHIGNGWFGGLLPATVFAMNAQSGEHLFFGLWYPIVIAAATAVIGLLFIPETKDRDIFAGDTSVHPGNRIVGSRSRRCRRLLR